MRAEHKMLKIAMILIIRTVAIVGELFIFIGNKV